MSANFDFIEGAIGAVVVLHIKETDPTVSPQTDPPTQRDMDLSTATVMQIDVKKPDATVQTFTAIFATGSEEGNGAGTDGRIKLTTTLATDFDQVGTYHAQAYVEFGSSPQAAGQSRSFTVGERFA